jgi:hypothetical protein
MKPKTPEANFLLAMFGKAVSVPKGRRMAEMAVDCSHQYELERAVPEKHDWRQLRNKRLGPQLAELLGDALSELNAKPFEDLAAVIRAVAKQKEQREAAEFIPGFHTKALWLASQVRLENHLPRNAPLPVVQLEFLRKVDKAVRAKIEKVERESRRRELHNNLRDALRYERRELARLGIRFASKGGRPQENRGTRNPKT